VIQFPADDPAAKLRNRSLPEDRRSVRRQRGRWTFSSSIYPLTYEGAVRSDGAHECSARPIGTAIRRGMTPGSIPNIGQRKRSGANSRRHPLPGRDPLGGRGCSGARSLDHRKDAGADRLGQQGPGGHDGVAQSPRSSNSSTSPRVGRLAFTSSITRRLHSSASRSDTPMFMARSRSSTRDVGRAWARGRGTGSRRRMIHVPW